MHQGTKENKAVYLGSMIKLLKFEVFLLNKVSFESDTSMMDSCIAREQSIGIHDVVND